MVYEGKGALHLRFSRSRGPRGCLRRLGVAEKYLKMASVSSFRVTAAYNLNKEVLGTRLTANNDVGNEGK